MKVEITNEGESYYIWANGKQERNMRSNFRPFNFYDDDIEKLIGEKAYKTTFQNGRYEYNVTRSHLDLITGQRSAQNRSELLLYPNG